MGASQEAPNPERFMSVTKRVTEGHRRANIASNPNVRPAAPMISGTAIAAGAASLLDGYQNHDPLASM